MRSSLEMDQFFSGLDTLSIGFLIRTSSATMKKLFVYGDPSAITVRKLQEILIPEFSPRGSNIREEEDAIIMNWNDYLKDIKGMTLHT